MCIVFMVELSFRCRRDGVHSALLPTTSLKPLVGIVHSRMELMGRRQCHVKKPDEVTSLFSLFGDGVRSASLLNL